MNDHIHAAFPLHTPGKTAKASPSDVRRNNRSLMFSLLFPTNRYSRADLGRLTGLSRVAVSDVVNDMLAEGLIRESGHETSTGKGKRGTLLSIDTTRLRIISLDLSQAHLIQGAVTDLLGLPQQRMEIALGPDNRIDADAIIQLVDQLATDTLEAVIGIGIAVPGVIQSGVIRESSALGWHDVDLRGLLEARFDVPVVITNDVISEMLTERFFGQAGPNLLFVKFDHGIGAATLIDDVTVVGEHHAGGEIGHISIDPENGPLCPCGKRGCMEMMLSVDALRERMRAVAKDERPDVIRDAAQRFAAALAMPVGLLDIADVCVYGPPDIVNNTFLEAAQHRLDLTTESTFHARTVIRRCQCGADITLRGGAIAVVRNHIESH
ncbi:ROK family transcriptional regulator [Bifidobacterium amazonense]|uniref:ROK family transcriptional regulator n=1 Tax=Bifidobacterium amazonense TaxID=2809027 RepID=A0ABS9VS47_9BIFI|nr:ROK family transcriptional regulator [Bifidobacterium amazonense]MCH9274751.1 ROK family transcriptional regulator [Bifidobacterium amazonense]